jgi:hypothetical protein
MDKVQEFCDSECHTPLSKPFRINYFGLSENVHSPRTFICTPLNSVYIYSASHSRVAPENVGLQKEQKCNTFACHTCKEVRLFVLGIRKKEVGNTKR